MAVAEKTSTMAPVTSRSDRFRSIALSKEMGITGLLIVLCAVTAWYSHGTFLSGVNLENQANLIGMFGIFSIGAGIVIITSGIDLTVGSMIALLGVTLSFMLTVWHWPWPLAVLAVLAAGGVLGLIHGLLITRVRLQPFIVTLCGLLIYRGAARFISQDNTMGFGDATGFTNLLNLATGNFKGIPYTFILMIVIAVIAGIFLHRSVYGRYLYAIGRNEEAARYSGINTRWIITGAYIVAAVLTATSAILFAFYTNSISPSSHGNFYELYGIAAAVLGGCSLRGGEGSIFGIIIGTAVLQLLHNLVNLVTIFGRSIPTSLEFAIMGAVILIGVSADQLLRKRPRKV
jgi:ribose transport system permease protein